MNVEDQINEIMDWFDFSRVHRTMIAVNWKWINEVPTEGEIRKKARELLKQLVQTKCIVVGTGGLEAYQVDGQLGLRFVLCDWYVEGVDDEQ